MRPETGPGITGQRKEKSRTQLVREGLLELIETELRPGQALPGERELMRTYAVSRETVRRALASLAQERKVHRIPGRGTFVSVPTVQTFWNLSSFTDELRERGMTPSTRLLQIDRMVPDEPIAQVLGLRPRQQAWRVQRLRFADDEPISVATGWYPAALLPDLDTLDLRLPIAHLIAAHYDLKVDRALQSVLAENADAETAAALQMTPGDAVFTFRRTAMVEDRAVEHTISRFRGDRYELQMRLDVALQTPRPSPLADPTPEGV